MYYISDGETRYSYKILKENWRNLHILRRIFERKRDEITGSWITLHNDKIHNYDTPLDIKMATTDVLTITDWTHKNVKYFELHKLT